MDKIYCIVVRHRDIIKYFNFSPPSITSYFTHVDLNLELENVFVFFMGLLNATKDNSSLAANEDVTLPKHSWEAPPKTEQFDFVSKHCRRLTHSSEKWKDARRRPKLSSLLLNLDK